MTVIEELRERGEQLTRTVWARIESHLAPAARVLTLVREHLGRLRWNPEPVADGAYGGMDRILAQKPPLRKYGPYVLGGGVVTIAAVWLLAGMGGSVYRVPIDRLTVATVTKGPFEDFAAVRATVAPFITDYLTTDQGGTVKQVLVEDGATVKAGEPLIVLSNPTLELEVASREADTARQIGDLENTELQLEQTHFKYRKDVLDIEYELKKLQGDLARDKRLADAQAIAPVLYEQDKQKYAYELKVRQATIESHKTEQDIRERQLAQLKDTLAQLNANVASARASLDALTIRAPMDGQLTALDAQVGQSKPQGAVLGQIDSRDRFKLTAQVDEFYLGRVALGQAVLFTMDGRDYKARVAKIYPQVANGTFKADLYFSGEPPAGIHNGQAIDIKLELGGAKMASMLPNGPFYQDTGGNWAFVVGPDGQSATRRNVRLGRRNPEFVEVLDGLKPGEKVIVSSYRAFDKMDRVEFEKSSGGNS